MHDWCVVYWIVMTSRVVSCIHIPCLSVWKVIWSFNHRPFYWIWTYTNRLHFLHVYFVINSIMFFILIQLPQSTTDSHCLVCAPLAKHIYYCTDRRNTDGLGTCNTRRMKLTHWDKEKGRHFPDDIFKCIFLKIYDYRLRFYWSLFLNVHLTIF